MDFPPTAIHSGEQELCSHQSTPGPSSAERWCPDLQGSGSQVWGGAEGPALVTEGTAASTHSCMHETVTILKEG